MKIYNVVTIDNMTDYSQPTTIGRFIDVNKARRLQKIIYRSCQMSDDYDIDVYIEEVELETINENAIKRFTCTEGDTSAYKEIENYVVTGEKTNKLCDLLVSMMLG